MLSSAPAVSKHPDLKIDKLRSVDIEDGALLVDEEDDDDADEVRSNIHI